MGFTISKSKFLEFDLIVKDYVFKISKKRAEQLTILPLHERLDINQD